MHKADLITILTEGAPDTKKSKSLTRMLSSQLERRNTLIACLDDKFICVYNLETETPRYKLPVHLVKYVQELRFLSRTQLIISCTYIDSKVLLWDLDRNKAIKTVGTLGVNLRVCG